MCGGAGQEMASTTSDGDAVRPCKHAPPYTTTVEVPWGTPLPEAFAAAVVHPDQHTRALCAVALALAEWPLVLSAVVADYAVDGAFTVCVLDAFGLDIAAIGYAEGGEWRQASYQSARRRLLSATETPVAVHPTSFLWRATAQARLTFPRYWDVPTAFVGGHLYGFGTGRVGSLSTSRVKVATGVCDTLAPPPARCRLEVGGPLAVVADRWVWLFGRYSYQFTCVYDTHSDTWRELPLRATDEDIWRILVVGFYIYLFVRVPVEGGPLECSLLDVYDYLSRENAPAPSHAPHWQSVAAPPFTAMSHVCALPTGALRVEKFPVTMGDDLNVAGVDYWPPVQQAGVWSAVAAAAVATEAVTASAVTRAFSPPPPPPCRSPMEFKRMGRTVGAYISAHATVCRVLPSSTHTHWYMGDQRMLIRKLAAYGPSNPILLYSPPPSAAPPPAGDDRVTVAW